MNQFQNKPYHNNKFKRKGNENVLQKDPFVDGQKTIVALNPFMLSKQLYAKHEKVGEAKTNCFKSGIKTGIKNTFKNKELKKHDKEGNIKNDVSLFWVFYTLLKESYEKTKMFQIKQDFSVKLLEQLKINKGDLKECKVKYCDFEQSILYDPDINAEALKVLCRIFKKNVVYVEKVKYYNFYEEFENSEILENDLFLIKKRENSYSCEKIDNKQILEQIEKSHFLVENVKKPINSASYYKLDEVKDLALKLNLKLQHLNGKNKTKTELYQEISGCLLQN